MITKIIDLDDWINTNHESLLGEYSKLDNKIYVPHFDMFAAYKYFDWKATQ